MSKAQYDINREIEAFINEKKKVGHLQFTRDEVAFINRFSGYGGLARFGATGKGLLSEYFTPVVIVERMVALAWKNGYNGGRVLEPSCGTGHFLKYFEPDTIVDAYEVNETSAIIASATYPSFNIINQYFNEIFVDRVGVEQDWQNKSRYDLVIGNPPYGKFTGKYTRAESAKTKARQYEEYFVTRGLDLLKDGGLLVFVIPSTFLDGNENEVKTKVASKAELLDAYRLPVRSFDQTGIQTDIVVFRRKNSI